MYSDSAYRKTLAHLKTNFLSGGDNLYYQFFLVILTVCYFLFSPKTQVHSIPTHHLGLCIGFVYSYI